MHKILPAITLFIALSSTAAEAPAGGDRALPAAGVIQTALAVPAGAAKAAAPQTVAAATELADEPDKPAGDGGSERTAGMLLGALALMIGIVLRRWGVGER